MGESNPYRTLPDESRNHNRGSVSERHAERMLWSLGFSVGTLSCLVVMAMLVDYHQPANPILVSDRFSFLKVVIPVGAASLSICLAVLLVVPVVLTGNLRPAWWLIPTTLVLLWFVYTYDWRGLFEFGRPRHHAWRDLEFFGFVLQRNGPHIALFMAWFALSKWALGLNKGVVANVEANADAEIRKIVDEQTAFDRDNGNSINTGNTTTSEDLNAKMC